MRKSIFLLLFFLFVLFSFKVDALDNNYVLVGCNSLDICGYDLDRDKLPLGISWDSDSDNIVLNNYDGGSLYIISDKDITITLKNNNTITINKELNYGIRLDSYNLTINSYNNGNLFINSSSNINNNVNGIVTSDDVILSSGRVNINLFGSSNYKGIICNNLNVILNSLLSININTSSLDEQYGIYNSNNFSISTTDKIVIDFNNHEDSFISNNIIYDKDKYVGTSLDNLKISYFNIAYKTISKISSSSSFGEITFSKEEAETYEEVSFDIIPSSHYEFFSLKFYDSSDIDVTSDISYDLSSKIFKMPSYDIVIKAVFIPVKYNINKELTINGSFDVVKQAVYDEKVILEVNPSLGYRISSINIKNAFTGTIINDLVNFNMDNLDFNMPDFDISISVNFIVKNYNIKKDITSSGSFNINNSDSASLVIPYKGIVKLTDLKPISSYSNIGFDLEIVDSLNNNVTESINFNRITNSFMMPCYDIKIKVTFKKVNYVIKDEVINGSIDIPKYVNAGDKIFINLKPNKGYFLRSIDFYDYLNSKNKLDINLNLNDYSFIMPNKFIIIKVNFIKNPVIPKVSTELYGYDDVKVSWNKVECDGYYLYYKKSTEKAYTYMGKTTKNEYKKKDLYDGKKYNFKVKAYTKDIQNNEYQSYSVSSIYTLKKIETPRVFKYSKNYIRIKWINIDGESGYQISRDTEKTGIDIIKTVNSSYNSFIFKTTKNKKYYYKIRSYKIENNKKIYGPWSNPKYYKLV